MDTKFSKQTRHELLEAPSAQVLPHLASQLAFSSIENAGMQQIIHWARQIERLIMSDSYGFERLLEAAGLINRHVDYPGKRQVVERCREEVQDLTSSGVISTAQGKTLRETLLGISVQTAG